MTKLWEKIIDEEWERSTSYEGGMFGCLDEHYGDISFIPNPDGIKEFISRLLAEQEAKDKKQILNEVKEKLLVANELNMRDLKRAKFALENPEIIEFYQRDLQDRLDIINKLQ